MFILYMSRLFRTVFSIFLLLPLPVLGQAHTIFSSIFEYILPHILFMAVVVGIMILLKLTVIPESNLEVVRKKAVKCLGAVMEAEEFCKARGVSKSELENLINERKLKAYSSGRFVFVQLSDKEFDP